MLEAPRLPPRASRADLEAERYRDALLRRVVGGGFDSAPETDEPPAHNDGCADLLGGRYGLIERLGAGGIGEVWRAEHEGIGKPVAVKFLRRELADEVRTRDRFLLEGRMASAVRHDNVVSVTDVGTAEDGRPYLVMELLEGVTLAEAIQESGPMDWPRAREIILQIADALACAHGNSVWHRDLKPGNVMVVEGRDGSDQCKVIDFGMAKGRLLDHEVVDTSRDRNIFGSPAYMSPEQFRGEQVDGRTDVYSLGCVAYFMLTGHRPFDGMTPQTLMYQHLFEPLPELVAPRLSEPCRADAEALLVRACAKRAADRYASMDELIAAVRSVGVPPRSAERPSRGHGAARRRPRLFSVATIVVTLGGVAALGLRGSEADESEPRERPSVHAGIPARAAPPHTATLEPDGPTPLVRSQGAAVDPREGPPMDSQPSATTAPGPEAASRNIDPTDTSASRKARPRRPRQRAVPPRQAPSPPAVGPAEREPVAQSPAPVMPAEAIAPQLANPFRRRAAERTVEQ